MNIQTQAGERAERQMAFYLHRAFAGIDGVRVLNGLRLVDAERTESDGSPAVCQIDHLVLHRWGVFIVESKSVSEEVSVRNDGAGGDEWTRRHAGREKGMPSPVQQARRQAELLRSILNSNREQLRDKTAVGLRTLAKLVGGSAHGGFDHMPIQIIVAIPDEGRINRAAGWKEPAKPFPTFVTKADLATEKIRREIDQHRSVSRSLTALNGEYGLWSMKPEELERVAQFLKESNTPRKPAEGPRCAACGSRRLTANWGKSHYYWSCGDCSKSTPMPTVCATCRAQGERGRIVRIRKAGPDYHRCCESCGAEELIWTAS